MVANKEQVRAGMNISKYIELVKSYSSLFLPVGVVIAAIAVYVPAHLMNSRLTAAIQKESLGPLKQIKSLQARVPSGAQWKVEADYATASSKDVNAIERVVRGTTQRPLLSYLLFPALKSESAFEFKAFAKSFCEGIRGMMRDINAGSCPTSDELKSAGSMSMGRSSSYPSTVSISAEDTIRDSICLQRASKIRVYVDQTKIGGFEFWQQYESAKLSSTEEAVKQCWYAQLSYWIIGDVFDTLKVMDGGSADVFNSPVKRLMSISFTDGISAGTSTAGNDAPSYVFSMQKAQVKPYTKRVTNATFDVVHFKISVVVDAVAVLRFMHELCSAKKHVFRGWDGKGTAQELVHNQITILQYQVSAADRASTDHERYRYGDNPVVELELACEYLFDKAGYDVVKPESVKQVIEKAIGETVGPATAPPPSPASGGPKPTTPSKLPSRNNPDDF